MRQGSLSFDPKSFEDFIYPAYFTGHLEIPYTLIMKILDVGITQKKKKKEEEKEKERGRKNLVLDHNTIKKVFSETVFDRMLGCFRVNNLRLLFIFLTLIFYFRTELSELNIFN